MSETDTLTQLLAERGDWTYVYVDGQSALPQVEEDARRRAVTDRLRETEASDADIEAIATALAEQSGIPSPSTRYLLVRDGRVELDESFDGTRLGDEVIGHGSVPVALPLLRHRAREIRSLIVETGRDGAELRLEQIGQADPEHVDDLEGRTDSLQKVQAGGLSHSRYQRRSEEIWKSNQADVADEVDRLVREHRPDVVLVAGDVRARQLLLESLGAEARELVVEVDAHTRADGADSEALNTAIDEAVEGHGRDALTDSLDRAAVDGGSGSARGWKPLLHAVQQAQVDTVIFDALGFDSDETFDVLDSTPWVADGEGAAFDAEVIARAPRAEAIARAALVTGARVLVREEAPITEGEPRPDRPVREPVAVLRWQNAAD